MAIEQKKIPYEFLARWDDAGTLRGAHVVFREAITDAGIEISSKIGDAMPVSLAGEAGFPIAEILDALHVDALADSEAKAAELEALKADKAAADKARDEALAQVKVLTEQLAALQPPTDKNGVPQVVSMVQVQLALLGAGLLDKVDATIASIPGEQGRAAQIEWSKAANVHRDHALIAALQGALGLTGEQIDALFIAAAKL